jgi:polyisoprenoid-binding protein YceI
MKRWMLLLAVIGTAPLPLHAQAVIFGTKQGTINFFSKAPLEDIDAKNDKVTSLLNSSTNEIAVRVPIQEFQFRNKLMQGHFNENYLESEKYPYATFKGKVNETIDYGKPGNYDVSATGVLNIHGVNQKRTLKGKMQITENNILLDTKFEVLLVDHKIKIPTLVFNKIAEKIAVTTSFNLSAQAK